MKKDKGFYPNMHVEKHNPVMEYSKADGGDYLNPNEELGELLIEGHKQTYGAENTYKAVPIHPMYKLGEQESSNAGDSGSKAGSVK